MKPFTPRQKHVHVVPKMKDMKSVRINANTLILVNRNVPDDDARERYLKRYKSGPKAPDYYVPAKIREEMAKVSNVGTLEELEAIVDETMKPDPD
jgi:hypothetical protein